MLLKDISFQTPQENILFDEVLLHLSEQNHGPEVLRFWESEILFIVLGRISKVNEDVRMTEVKRDNIPVLRRCSGGGTVLQGKGCLNYSLVLSKEKHPELADIRRSYQWIFTKVIHALANLSIHAKYQPISDLALIKENKKFSGNAQKRSRRFILHHGTILYNFNLSSIVQYLTFPQQVPKYREGRSHVDFLNNISVSADAIRQTMIQEFRAQDTEHLLTEEEIACLRKHLSTKNPSVDLDN